MTSLQQITMVRNPFISASAFKELQIILTLILNEAVVFVYNTIDASVIRNTRIEKALIAARLINMLS